MDHPVLETVGRPVVRVDVFVADHAAAVEEELGARDREAGAVGPEQAQAVADALEKPETAGRSFEDELEGLAAQARRRDDRRGGYEWKLTQISLNLYRPKAGGVALASPSPASAPSDSPRQIGRAHV